MATMMRLKIERWTKNYALFNYTVGSKRGKIYIPREILKDEIISDPHLIIHPEEMKDED